MPIILRKMKCKENCASKSATLVSTGLYRLGHIVRKEQLLSDAQIFFVMAAKPSAHSAAEHPRAHAKSNLDFKMR
jgi:hypothetical protein